MFQHLGPPTFSISKKLLPGYLCCTGQVPSGRLRLWINATASSSRSSYRKSPFDLSTCHHAHQELVKGLLTDYSGPFLALTEIGHCFEVALLLGICTLFWATSWIGMAVLLAVTYFLEVLVDNITSRMNWRWMLSYVWGVGLTLSLMNLIWLQQG